ncbi:MAG: cellulase family glycosylhydrolase [Sedimentisphaerales bacterium]|nr:cellulase family glycosylhydrolase [Sedimentisphaerales bacterium]
MIRRESLISMLSAILILTLSASRGDGYEVGDVPFYDDFENGTQTSNNWSSDHLYVFDAGYSGQGIRIANADSNSAVYISTTLPADLKGYPVYLSAIVRGSDISPKPNHWNGVKCMMVYKTSDGETGYPQADADIGTFGWTNIACLIYLPQTVTNISLTLGLEKVSGTVWFDDVRVKVAGLDQRFPPRPNQPIYKGHSFPRLRGAMVPTSLTADSLITFAQEWKGNNIRWQLGQCAYPDGLETTNYDSILDSELAKMDALLPVCQSNRVMVVVDLHSLSRGVLKSAANQTKFKQVWNTIATRYTNSAYRDTIWGYDLANEPQPTEWREGALLWNDIAEQTAQMIREIDPVMPIIVETHIGGPLEFQYFQPISVSNVIYSTHMYIPGEYTHQHVLEGLTNTYSYPGIIPTTGWAGTTNWNKEALEYVLRRAIAFATNYSAHIYIGEFSAVRWAVGASNYLDDCISIFEQYGWDWSYHAFREWSGWDTEYSDQEGDFTHPVPTGRQTVLRQWYSWNELDAYGIPCNWKIQYFDSTNAPGAGALDDPDGDGMNNYGEWRAGTIPTNAESVLRVSDVGCRGEEMVVTWPSVADKWYAIQTSTNLLAGFDGYVTNGIPATPTVNTQTVIMDSIQSRFYRVMVEP